MPPPPSVVCPMCALQDHLRPPTSVPEGGWQFICEGHTPPWLFEVTSKTEETKYPSGVAADLGLYDDLPKCVSDPGTFVEYGIVEYRYSTAHPSEYDHLVRTYGHRKKQPSPYTA